MRKMVIKLPKASYTPGEEIRGALEVICDKPFNSNGTTISIQGVMQVKGESYPAAPKDKVVIETKALVQALLGEATLLSPPRRYEAGTHKFNFLFHLPPSTYYVGDNIEVSSGLFPSYDGKYASIEYSIQAEIEVSRSRNVKTKTPLFIFIPIAKSSKELQTHIVGKGERIVEFEADTLDLCIGSPLELRYRFNSYQLISKVRVEIIHKESTRVGHARNFHSQTYCKVDVRPRKHDIEKWQTLALQPRRSIPHSFKTKHVTSSTVLKVTTQLTDLTKNETIVPLMAYHCPVKKAQTKPLGLSCPHCQEELADISGVIRPDGSVICPKCFKRFMP